MPIYFGGSRNLQANHTLGAVVDSVLVSGQSIHVGCAIGADALVITSALIWGPASSLVVFACFDQSGAGSWYGSSVGIVQAAASRGAAVHYLAGGSLQIPIVQRLMVRSIAGLSGASAAVFFSPGPGSLKVAAEAVSRHIPVYAFSQLPPPAPRHCAGQWRKSNFQRFPCWQWQSAQKSFI